MNTNKMNKLFLVLGLGIGLLISSLLNIAYPKIKYIPYTDSQIIEKARELGMVPLKEAISNSNSNNEEEIAATSSTDSGKNDNPAEEKNHTVEFVINKGDNSERIVNKLFEEGIIKDKEEFTKKIVEKELQRKFKHGVYELKIDMEYDSIIKILTGK